MRIGHRYLTYGSDMKIIKAAIAILTRYNISYKYKKSQYIGHTLEFYLYEDNPAFSLVKAEIDTLDIEPQTASFYDKEDMSRADWFKAETGNYQYPQPEDDFGYREATFNLDSYCHHCGIGSVQDRPYRLKTEPKQLNNQFWGLHWDYEPIFVRQEAKNILENEAIKGIRFSSPVLHKKNTPIDQFYQLHIDTILDKGFDSSNTTMITCKHNNEEDCNGDPHATYCGRVKFHHSRIGGYRFDENIFKPGIDIALTNEHFGSGASSNRITIVSKRLKEIVEKNKLKGLYFTPILPENLRRIVQ